MSGPASATGLQLRYVESTAQWKQEPAGASHMLAGGTPALSGLGGRQLRDRVTPSDLGGSGLL